MGRRAESWWVLFVGVVGIANFAAFLWLAENTEPPPIPVAVALLVATGVLLIGPWAYLAVRRLDADLAARHIVRRVLTVVAVLGVTGVALAVPLGAGEDSDALPVVMMSIIGAGVLALAGLVAGPWLFLLTRMVTRERAARVRAEERAAVANHLHDSVLQTLTLIQKRAGANREVARLARSSERELRRWLYDGVSADGDDLAAALTRATADVEDRFGVSVELVTVGTCALDDRGRALVGAATEAVTNAAKHASIDRVSVFAEVGEGEALVIVRDRGCGFDPAVVAAEQCGGHGLSDSIERRMRQQDGTATVRSKSGAGTIVELRMPLRRMH